MLAEMDEVKEEFAEASSQKRFLIWPIRTRGDTDQLSLSVPP
jgi:hypothetical protein